MYFIHLCTKTISFKITDEKYTVHISQLHKNVTITQHINQTE